MVSKLASSLKLERDIQQWNILQQKQIHVKKCDKLNLEVFPCDDSRICLFHLPQLSPSAITIITPWPKSHYKSRRLQHVEIKQLAMGELLGTGGKMLEDSADILNQVIVFVLFPSLHRALYENLGSDWPMNVH